MQKQTQQKQAPPQRTTPAAATAIEKAAPHSAGQQLAEIPEWLRRPEGVPPAGLDAIERSESDPKYIEGLRDGQFFNTITREIYGKKVLLVPLHFYKTRVLFGPMDE